MNLLAAATNYSIPTLINESTNTRNGPKNGEPDTNKSYFEALSTITLALTNPESKLTKASAERLMERVAEIGSLALLGPEVVWKAADHFAQSQTVWMLDQTADNKTAMDAAERDYLVSVRRNITRGR